MSVLTLYSVIGRQLLQSVSNEVLHMISVVQKQSLLTFALKKVATVYCYIKFAKLLVLQR
jgi:hypothetical protein